MSKLTNKVVWITGASSGIGEALTYALATKGAKLILSARRKEELERVKGNCSEDAQLRIKVLPMDLSKTEILAMHVEMALHFFGKIDILINNGGISQRSLAKDTILEVDRQLMEVNYFAPVQLTKLLLPSMMELGSGHLVNITSLVGKFGSPYRSGYAASKHAVHGFFDSLRAEMFNHNITVTNICPGFIRTNVSINALTENATALGQMDQAQDQGMDPGLCAKKIVYAIERKKQEAYIGGKETYGVLIKRFFPSLFDSIIRKSAVR
jgi:short-subunit dehydrogenase